MIRQKIMIFMPKNLSNWFFVLKEMPFFGANKRAKSSKKSMIIVTAKSKQKTVFFRKTGRECLKFKGNKKHSKVTPNEIFSKRPIYKQKCVTFCAFSFGFLRLFVLYSSDFRSIVGHFGNFWCIFSLILLIRTF